MVNALHQDLGPPSVDNARDPIGSTVVDSGQQANRFSPLTAEIEEEPLSGFRPTIAESDTDTLENPSIFGESEVHEDHVARDAAGPATEVRVTAAIRLGFEGLDFVDFSGHILGQSPCDEVCTWILERPISVCHEVGCARGQYSQFEPE